MQRPETFLSNGCLETRLGVWQRTARRHASRRKRYKSPLSGCLRHWTPDISKMLLQLLALSTTLLAAAAGDDVCYEPLGCFSTEFPWYVPLLRPLPAPAAPEVVETRFYLYTSKNRGERYNVRTRPEASVNGSNFSASRPTIFITHGFSSDGNSTWLADMKDALLGKVDSNVFLTDWGKGASTVNYLQVASNTRVVAAEMVRLVRHLVDKWDLKPASLHLIGHSLGAQISSYVAKNISGVARITALDPAQPAFEGFNRKVRLDASDAVYVEVIHTDAKPLIPFLGFGMIGAAGDCDYYINGGVKQPGCIVPDPAPNITSLLDLAKIPIEVIGNIVSCPHSRSYKVYTEALRNDSCTFWGHPSSFIDNALGAVTRGVSSRFLTPSAEDCTVKSCSPLGYESLQYPARGVFTVGTFSSAPYCIAEPEVDAAMARSLLEHEQNQGAVSRRPGFLDSLRRNINRPTVPSFLG